MPCVESVSVYVGKVDLPMSSSQHVRVCSDCQPWIYCLDPSLATNRSSCVFHHFLWASMFSMMELHLKWHLCFISVHIFAEAAPTHCWDKCFGHNQPEL